jgi:hypothetical protein
MASRRCCVVLASSSFVQNSTIQECKILFFFIQIWYYGVQLGQIPYNSLFVKNFLVKGLVRFEDCKLPHRVDLTKILNPPHMPHGVDLSSPFFKLVKFV